MQCSFGHSDGYSAVYYTYEWSQVIAKDLSAFDKKNLLDPAIAKRYRNEVLRACGTRPARESVKAFLGRDYDFKAFDEWLAEVAPRRRPATRRLRAPATSPAARRDWAAGSSTTMRETVRVVRFGPMVPRCRSTISFTMASPRPELPCRHRPTNRRV